MEPLTAEVKHIVKSHQVRILLDAIKASLALKQQPLRLSNQTPEAIAASVPTF